MVRVWDLFVRCAHWALVVSVVSAWLLRHTDGPWHIRLGYTALAIVVARIVWGFIGTDHARFAEFVRSPRTTIAYARAVLTRREPRHLGHNPLGAWMILALIVTIALLGLTGWMSTTDAYWGIAWVADTHEMLSDALIALVALHLAGVIFSSIRHRENLVAAMVHGRKRR
jgi:cytochrome b